MSQPRQDNINAIFAGVPGALACLCIWLEFPPLSAMAGLLARSAGQAGASTLIGGFQVQQLRETATLSSTTSRKKRTKHQRFACLSLPIQSIRRCGEVVRPPKQDRSCSAVKRHLFVVVPWVQCTNVVTKTQRFRKKYLFAWQ
jgi:hypothetical protein